MLPVSKEVAVTSHRELPSEEYHPSSKGHNIDPGESPERHKRESKNEASFERPVPIKSVIYKNVTPLHR